MTKVHAIRTGSVRVKRSQMAGRGSGIARLGHVLVDPDWSDWVPIHAWLIEHDQGLILVDTGETARVHQRGYHPRWHPFFRRASRFRVAPDEELGPQLERMGVRTRDIREVVLTHLHTDHAGGLAHVIGRKTWLHPIEWRRAQGVRGQVQGYLPHRWPQWWDPEPLRFEPFAFGPFRERMALTSRGDVFAVPTPGHTPGHVSVIVQGAPSIFIAGDTSYTEELLKDGVVDGVSPDEGVARLTNQHILALAREQPLVYLPSHDPQSADRLARLVTLTPRDAE
jgi:glyoxylase-like metal-dependent hydrolase (beta-lactamase superfamily II)